MNIKHVDNNKESTQHLRGGSDTILKSNGSNSISKDARKQNNTMSMPKEQNGLKINSLNNKNIPVKF
jgi:hypothetical protein